MNIACQIQNQHLLRFRLFQVFLLSVLLFVFNGHHSIKERSKSQVLINICLHLNYSSYNMIHIDDDTSSVLATDVGDKL